MNKTFSKYDVLRSRLCFCIEFLLINCAVTLATVVRFSSDTLALSHGVSYVPPALLVACICQLCMYYADLYDLHVPLSRHKLLMKLFQALAGATVILTVLFYVLPPLTLGRGIFLPALAGAFWFIAGWRLLYQRLNATGPLRVKVLILGTGVEAQKLAQALLDNPLLGYEVKGLIADEPAQVGAHLIHSTVLGTPEQLPAIMAREGIDKVVVALSERREKLPLEALLRCKLQGVDVQDVTTFYERISGRVLLDNLRPSWIIFSQGFALTPLLQSVKRLTDILLAGLGLLLAAPLMPVVALLIKLDSRGPVFFAQQRAGQEGRVFVLFKFRSMQVDAEAATGPVFADQNDSRITRVGRLLRSTRLDELPQLLNVLKGEMSFVGPRPERPFFIEQLVKDIPYYLQRLSVKPGLTGWAQVNYHYGATTEDAVEKLQLDLYYIKNMSLLLDLSIILKTVKIALLGTGAR